MSEKFIAKMNKVDVVVAILESGPRKKVVLVGEPEGAWSERFWFVSRILHDASEGPYSTKYSPGQVRYQVSPKVFKKFKDSFPGLFNREYQNLIGSRE